MGIGKFLLVIRTKIYEPDWAICKFKKKKNIKFIWSEKQQKAFDRLKVITAKKPAVKIFDRKKDITLTTDTSEHSVSGIFHKDIWNMALAIFIPYGILLYFSKLIGIFIIITSLKLSSISIWWYAIFKSIFVKTLIPASAWIATSTLGIGYESE